MSASAFWRCNFRRTAGGFNSNHAISTGISGEKCRCLALTVQWTRLITHFQCPTRSGPCTAQSQAVWAWPGPTRRGPCKARSQDDWAWPGFAESFQIVSPQANPCKAQSQDDWALQGICCRGAMFVELPRFAKICQDLARCAGICQDLPKYGQL